MNNQTKSAAGTRTAPLMARLANMAQTVFGDITDHDETQALSTNSCLSVDVITDLDALEGLQDDWLALERRQHTSAIAFQTYDLCLQWVKHFIYGDDGRSKQSICIVTVRNQSQLVLVLPLVIPQQGPLRIAQWLGMPLAQYGDVLIDPECDQPHVLEKALETLVRVHKIDGLNLQRMRADARCLQSALIAEHVSDANVSAPYIDMQALKDFDGFQASMKTKRKKSRRRRRRRLEEIGTLSFEVAEGGPRAGELMAEALEFKREWMEKHGLVSAAFAQRATRQCLIDMAKGHDGRCDWALTATLLDGKPIAIEAGIIAAGWYHSYLGTYHPDYAQYGVGNVQLEDTIAWAFEQGFVGYDMLAPSDDYKLEWAEESLNILQATLPMTMKGRLYLSLWSKRMRPALKELFLKLPTGLRQKLATSLSKL